MTKRFITLGCGRTIGLGKYVAAWKQCLALEPKTWIGAGVSGVGESAGEALAGLRKGLDDRINRNIPGYGKGRKWSYEWQGAVYRAAGDLNNPRLIVRWLPPDLMKVERFKARVEYGRAA